MKQLSLKDGTHAGELDDETLEEVWDHLDEGDAAPVFDADTMAFFEEVNGSAPQNASVNGVRITRFLNFCNTYDPANAEISRWHIVRNRTWIADRLDPRVIPIAELAHGDYLCLNFANSGSPSVVRWIHEQSVAGRPAYEAVANDLSMLLAKIEQH